MCRPVSCKTCGRTAWAGCGQHVDQVMATVPPAQRCPGHIDPQAPSTSRSFLSRILGRS